MSNYFKCLCGDVAELKAFEEAQAKAEDELPSVEESMRTSERRKESERLSPVRVASRRAEGAALCRDRPCNEIERMSRLRVRMRMLALF